MTVFDVVLIGIILSIPLGVAAFFKCRQLQNQPFAAVLKNVGKISFLLFLAGAAVIFFRDWLGLSNFYPINNWILLVGIILIFLALTLFGCRALPPR